MRALLQAGAAVDQADSNEVTPLNMACDEQHEACALLLLHHGADPDVTDNWGDTPRSVATNNGLSQVLAMLQQRGD